MNISTKSVEKTKTVVVKEKQVTLVLTESEARFLCDYWGKSSFTEREKAIGRELNEEETDFNSGFYNTLWYILQNHEF